MPNYISVKGAKEHNLKNIDVKIPRDKLVVITGVSGSGKSSLAFDTIYAEGQRRYVESLSAYARQFLGIMEKPDVDYIDGLSPAISIDQRSSSANPRSTVGTVTEVYDYLRLLFARIGVPHCPICGRKVVKQTIDQVIKQIQDLPSKKVLLLAPLVKDRKGELKGTLENIRKARLARVRVDGIVYALEEKINLDGNKRHTIEAVVDSFILSGLERSRLASSLETALDLGNGQVVVVEAGGKKNPREWHFSLDYSCPVHGSVNLGELEPRNFSFNSPHGACPRCTGLGYTMEIDPKLLIPNPKLSIAEGAIRPWGQASDKPSWYFKILEAVAKKYGFSLSVPVSKMKQKDLNIILYGTEGETVEVPYRTASGRKVSYETVYEGIVPNLNRRYRETDSDFIRSEIQKYMTVKICPECHGARLKKEILGVTVGGKSIAEVTSFSIREAVRFFKNLKLGKKEQIIAHQILREIKERLGFLIDVGLSYLTLERSASTLSGGESQRTRLATQIGSGLSGVIYILDEPSIGLHQYDNKKLIGTLKHLRDLGNTVLVVEHDEQTIESADWVIDLGPGAGDRGGKLVAEGTPAKIKKSASSLTGRYLTGKEKIPIPPKRRKGNGQKLDIIEASEFNLKNINVSIPLGTFTCVTGLSGSGKSTLINEILAKQLAIYLHGAKGEAGAHKDIRGIRFLDKIISIDQSPIGKSPRSNPATYIGVFTDIRHLFASLPEAQIRGYGPGRFSFNVKGGRCENCRGEGVIKIEMHFLPDVYITCDVCKGKRYTQEVLDIYYKDKNISDVLNMTVNNALKFFGSIPAIKSKLKTLADVGLGYIKLGQPATQLSGGEAQRIKLATELSRRATGKTLYVLDEPTTGLHFDDIKKLLGVLHRLVERGNTVVVIEHNLDVIKTADYIIDLGPEGGDRGGEVVATGTPEEVAKVKESYTGQYLKRMLRD